LVLIRKIPSTTFFWRDLNGVCNALDNVKARKYSDSKCIFYSLPLLESGTMGTLSNSDIIIPFQTPSYSEHNLPPEDTDKIPMCTLRNFPNLIEHCIEWSRAQFTDLFEMPAKDFNSLLKNPPFFIKNLAKEDSGVQYERLKEIRFMMDNIFEPTYERCILMAHSLLLKNFRDKINDLIAIYPKDYQKKDPYTEEKTFFWAGAKTFPQAIEFFGALPEESHVLYLYAVANLYATMYDIEPVRDLNIFHERLVSLDIKNPPWELNHKTSQMVKKDLENEEKTVEELEEERKKKK